MPQNASKVTAWHQYTRLLHNRRDSMLQTIKVHGLMMMKSTIKTAVRLIPSRGSRYHSDGSTAASPHCSICTSQISTPIDEWTFALNATSLSHNSSIALPFNEPWPCRQAARQPGNQSTTSPLNIHRLVTLDRPEPWSSPVWLRANCNPIGKYDDRHSSNRPPFRVMNDNDILMKWK